MTTFASAAPFKTSLSLNDQAVLAQQQGQLKRARLLFERAAAAGEALAAYNLAIMRLQGEGGTKQRQQGWQMLEALAATELGQPTQLAQFALGRLYENGRYGRQSSLQALEYYRQAARQGHVEAQVSVALLYFSGAPARGEIPGIPEDLRLAAYWFEQAAQQGDVAAQYILASMYEHGHGVTGNLTAAYRWYHAAALQGDVAAIAKLQRLAVSERTASH
ncbi:tetratricopeptide repeat protein [Parvibium lacunae]|uniref:tetratricopeptide repeat protein n=1 Tax=Parvibium lacunae TaxID=1888893 RepID=UPI001314E4D8|nr:tetratricopeptide repeat protein [Parvibium lacunae]